MDKAEYREKLDEIKALADAGDFDTAADKADDIEWRRVKSARTLCMIGEIYERVGRLEDSRRVLEIAYKRSPDSKTVLYRLSELCIRLGDFDAALDYFTEFTEVSPTDNSKYILKYKLYRARKSPIQDQIAILEAYKEAEFTERWAYELARLYSQAGNKEKCIEVCDDIILWFGEGKYVTKSMELKMQYTSLSPSQQLKYQETMQRMRTVPRSVAATKMTMEEAGEVLDEEEQEESAVRTERAIEKMNVAASTTVMENAGLKMPQRKAISRGKMADPVRMQNQLADSIRQVFSGLNQRGSVQETDSFAMPEEKGPVDVYKPLKEDFSNLEVKELEPEQLSSEQAHAANVSRAVVNQVPAENGQIAGQMSLKDLEKPEEELDLEALFSETSSMLAQEVATGAFVKTDDALEEKLDPEDAAIRRAAEEEAARIEAEELAARKAAAEEAAAHKAAEEAARRAAAEEAARKAAEEEAARKAAEEAVRKAAEEAAARKAAEEEAARKAAEEEAARKAAEEEAARKAAEEAARKENEEALLYAKETDETLGLTKEFNFQDELKKAQMSEEDIFAAELAKAVAELRKDDVKDEEAETITIISEPVTLGEANPVIKNDFAGEMDELAKSLEESAEEAVTEELEETFVQSKEQPEENVTEELLETVDEHRDEKEDTPEETTEQLDEMVYAEEGPKRLPYVMVEPRPFDEEEKKIFTYFTTIPGMSQQITEVLADIHNNAGDKTSKSGNVLLIGRQGSGKTRLCDALVLAVCKDLEIEAVKVAKVIGRDFNKKDPAAVVSKLSGGFLIIEGAGELTKDTAGKLSQAMEFRTDSLVVILEDEKHDLNNMLAKNPELAEKFTSTITIPVFTNDELVAFAKSYAKECGYRMDDMAILALYTLIGDNQKDAEPISVAKVKWMIDRAIERANKGTRKFGRKLSKKSVDEDNRIILLEKDFDFNIE